VRGVARKGHSYREQPPARFRINYNAHGFYVRRRQSHFLLKCFGWVAGRARVSNCQTGSIVTYIYPKPRNRRQTRVTAFVCASFAFAGNML